MALAQHIAKPENRCSIADYSHKRSDVHGHPPLSKSSRHRLATNWARGFRRAQTLREEGITAAVWQTPFFAIIFIAVHIVKQQKSLPSGGLFVVG